ncbi:N-acetyltransferase [Corallococcus sp. H22C18031201]|uniref:GNAT family N-acetyltransferase n=1 Tax=Citreicoccus inhibens TaxID=2849499 RepID=UPI000E75ADDF|nr:GNAT family protein [Citreicoccus inhibens]MBU8900023.1 GNAT family N-acetyltransferase [Citreicoccus inhibens]RJS20015.1 N-acetyltransferase [Corallococcus sp. H22C18031201]
MTSPAVRPTPYQLRTPRLLLRCVSPSDAEARKEAFDSSGTHLDHLFPPPPEGRLTLDAHAAILRRYRGSFDLDQDRFYGAFDPTTGKLLGETGVLRRAGIRALELSYWLRRDAVGQGYAVEMARAMMKVAFVFDQATRMDLTCDVANTQSAGVAHRLGFTLEGRLRDRQLAPHHKRGDILCFTLLDTEYAKEPAHHLPIEAFDLLGRRID